MSAHEAEIPGGSGREDREFSELLAGFANRELTEAELARLQELAAALPRRSDQVKGLDEVHTLFARERTGFRELASPATPRERAEPGYRRLQAAAAAGEELLRGRLLRGVEAVEARRWPRVAWIAGAAAAVLLVGLLVVKGDAGPPDLISGDPGRERMGGPAQISLTAEITAESRTVSWVPVDGASTYTVSVEDAAGNVVLRRGEAEARSTRWELSEAEFRTLRGRTDGSLLQVVARNSAGIVVGTTGRLPLSIR